jgi:hypothetical protein
MALLLALCLQSKERAVLLALCGLCCSMVSAACSTEARREGSAACSMPLACCLFYASSMLLALCLPDPLPPLLALCLLCPLLPLLPSTSCFALSFLSICSMLTLPFPCFLPSVPTVPYICSISGEPPCHFLLYLLCLPNLFHQIQQVYG